jgi:hypothetical protein
MRILIILNADAASQPGAAPEYEGLIEAYYLFDDAGAEVVIVTPGGGSAYDAGFVADADAASSFGRFKIDRRARDLMNDLVDIGEVCVDDFDAALCLQRQAVNGGVKIEGEAHILLERLLDANKPVAVIGAARFHESVATKNGLLILGYSRGAPSQAAKALIGAINSVR